MNLQVVLTDLFDLPGVEPTSIDLTVERNVLSVHAERQRPGDDDVELVIGERPIGSVDIATTASRPTSIDAPSNDTPSPNDQRSEPVAAAT